MTDGRSASERFISLASTSTSSLLLDGDEESECRPMSSHARIEGAIETTPRRRKKIGGGSFLPQLNHARAFAMGQKQEQANDTDTDDFKKAMWAGQANILVTVRLRPLLQHDRDQESIVKILDHNVVVVLDQPTSSSGHATAQPKRTTGGTMRGLRLPGATSRRSREKRYAFDYVFAPADGQQKVYSHTTKFLIHGVLNGFNATVFAYGCTGAGKTYTMLGTKTEPGIMALTLDDLFHNIERIHADPEAMVTYKVTVSFLEVYNENIRDLLIVGSGMAGFAGSSNVNGGQSEYLDLREDPIRGPIVAGISEIEAGNAKEVMKLLRKGNKRRSQEATAANSVSSRSHAVLQVLVEQHDKVVRTAREDHMENGMIVASVVKIGKLSLVDLAGSERAAVTQNRGQRLLEGANINRSLLALGNCINALGEKAAGSSSSSASTSFVPYRDSKLTRLLKDSLGGNCRTVMIANISQACASFEETLNTLKYANRAKNIKTNVTRNVLNVDHHITEYVSVISNLKSEITTLKNQLQQQHLEAPEKPKATAWVQENVNVTDSTGYNHPSDNNHDDSAPEDEGQWAQRQVIEARQYIMRCFQERLQLRKRLIEIGHQLQLCAEEKKSSAQILDDEKSGLYNSDFLAAQPESQTARDANQQDAALLAVELSPKAITDTAGKIALLENMASQLTTSKERILEQLHQNEERLAVFRLGIEQNTFVMRNEFLRELISMEYRVGELEIEKVELQFSHELKSQEIDRLKSKLKPHEREEDQYFPHHVPQHPNCGRTVHLPLIEKMTAFLTQTDQADTARSEMTHLPEIDVDLQSYRAQAEILDRNTPTRAQQYAAPSFASTSSARRPWGLHITNSSLPYIRLKKKVQEGISPKAYDSVRPTEKSVSSVTSTTSLTAPYLKVLKHRRKSLSKPTPQKR